ncbi:DUF6765 family protein [Desulfosporosinus sp. BICA1-9]|uniref:DUF6765 family protein n=1 Tax=Desulfosporosinus sp. BICA1-9 TaxID=1531958 RepID=UPI00054B5F38|nr:DUF6765 family protein [Desulfosporosinus sp. BICA1-9]KJS48967.1 MAG: signal peptide protein [Peptococcaceae bacterium BRH_c23]KJS84047.1 MAG: signal peptide protein [Desulfosporosinus sp. BICA1-9]HBW33898.1 hypothetical protein [Desulfosporosinus sp.]
MNRDAHFYAVLAFCRACGFKKESAHIIAYASQLVDDAKINLIYFKKSGHNVEHELVDNRLAFFNMATCHSYFRIKTFNYEALINNTCAFHFVPGCKGENFTQKLRCGEESPVILDILSDAFHERDLIKLGIVLHAYADTFAHQGFSGLVSKVNDIKSCEAQSKVSWGLIDRSINFVKQLNQDRFETYFDHFRPAYGHCQAMDYPDLPYLKWSYDYDYSDEFNGSYENVEIDNKERYQRAFRSIKRHVEQYLTQHPQFLDQNLKFKNFELLMNALTLEGTDQQRESNWQRLMIEQGLFTKTDSCLFSYEEDQWLKEAFSNYDRKRFDNRTVEGVQLASDFRNSNWYGFYRAVKWYKKKFFQYCSNYRLSIPN